MDLNEHTLTEAQRTLKRLGVTHVLRPEAKAPQTPQLQSASLQTPPPTTTHVPSAAPAPSPSRRQASPSDEAPLPLLLRSLFHGKQIPARTLWTYAGLLYDMQETDNPPRLNVFKKIQDSVCQHLKWNPGSLCSWPLDLDSTLFAKGLSHFKPQTILFFSGHAAKLGADAKKNLLHMEQAGSRVVVLPDLEAMAQGDQKLKNEAWRILQTLQN
ncbi:MAG: hypothetical protein AB7D27_05965 [Desulfomicrobium sp.]